MFYNIANNHKQKIESFVFPTSPQLGLQLGAQNIQECATGLSFH